MPREIDGTYTVKSTRQHHRHGSDRRLKPQYSTYTTAQAEATQGARAAVPHLQSRNGVITSSRATSGAHRAHVRSIATVRCCTEQLYAGAACSSAAAAHSSFIVGPFSRCRSSRARSDAFSRGAPPPPPPQLPLRRHPTPWPLSPAPEPPRPRLDCRAGCSCSLRIGRAWGFGAVSPSLLVLCSYTLRQLRPDVEEVRLESLLPWLRRRRVPGASQALSVCLTLASWKSLVTDSISRWKSRRATAVSRTWLSSDTSSRAAIAVLAVSASVVWMSCSCYRCCAVQREFEFERPWEDGATAPSVVDASRRRCGFRCG